VSIPIESVWSFISDMDMWAPLVPGYITHKIVSDRQSIWEFKGDIGIIQKIIRLKIDITEWQEPTEITFDLTGLNENVKGNGYFKAEKIIGCETQITGYLHITARGIMGRLINPVLKSYLPKTTKQLTNAVAIKMKEREVMLT
jgi:carbon monoxide dehydrogenase subunit G